MTTDAAALERTAGRVLVVDSLERVLLLRGSDPADPDAGSWWFTPGGGLDPGESIEQAARRELAEETGLVLDQLGPAVWMRTAEFDFMGDHYRQKETFFLARVEAGAATIDFSGHTPIERDAVHGYRWWTLAELASTDETVYPTSLGAELALILTDGPPERPKEVAA